VSRVYTEYAVFAIDDQGVTAPRTLVSPDELSGSPALREVGGVNLCNTQETCSF
jgi:hypothetical protein